MKIVKLGPQYQLHIYLCKIEHEPSIDCLEEVASEEVEVSYESCYDKSKNLAKDLLDSFYEHLSVNDLMEIRKACSKRVIEHWQKYSPKRLEEETYKKLFEDLENEK